MHPTAATHRDQTSREMRRMHLQDLVWDMEELRGVGEPASAARVYFVTFFVFVFPVSWEGRRYKGLFLRRGLVTEVGGILAFGDGGEECVDTKSDHYINYWLMVMNLWKLTTIKGVRIIQGEKAELTEAELSDSDFFHSVDISSKDGGRKDRRYFNDDAWIRAYVMKEYM